MALNINVYLESAGSLFSRSMIYEITSTQHFHLLRTLTIHEAVFRIVCERSHIRGELVVLHRISRLYHFHFDNNENVCDYFDILFFHLSRVYTVQQPGIESEKFIGIILCTTHKYRD